MEKAKRCLSACQHFLFFVILVMGSNDHKTNDFHSFCVCLFLFSLCNKFTCFLTNLFLLMI